MKSIWKQKIKMEKAEASSQGFTFQPIKSEVFGFVDEEPLPTVPVPKVEGEEEKGEEEAISIAGKEVAEEEEEEDVDGFGNPTICKLSKNRRVAVQDFKGQKLVSIREYYDKDGKQFPGTKGISLTSDQWKNLAVAIPSIDEAIKKAESG